MAAAPFPHAVSEKEALPAATELTTQCFLSPQLPAQGGSISPGRPGNSISIVAETLFQARVAVRSGALFLQPASLKGWKFYFRYDGLRILGTITSVPTHL